MVVGPLPVTSGVTSMRYAVLSATAVVMLDTGVLIAAGALPQFTPPSVQAGVSAARRNSPPLGELSSVALPTVSRSLAEAMVGQVVPAPVPTTSNFIRNWLTGLVSIVMRVAEPALTVLVDSTMVASAVTGNIRVPPPAAAVVALTVLLAADLFPGLSTALTV